jgi:predicted ATPase
VYILATSRESLRAGGEWLLRLPSLEVPSGAALTAREALGYSAVELFNERAAAAMGGFVLSDTDVPDALEICRGLDGMPLALELAAAQVEALGVKGIAAALEDRLAVLTRGRRTALARHQTLRAAIDWSYDLLSPTEQTVLRRAAVFMGDFALEAARLVCSGNGLTGADVFAAVTNLAAKSLIVTDIAGEATSYRLSDTTRAYAGDKLTASGELDRVRRLHAEVIRDLFRQADAEVATGVTAEWREKYGLQIANLRSALHWTFSPNGDAALGITLTTAAIPVWMHLSLMEECRGSVDRALAALDAAAGGDARSEMQLSAALGASLAYTSLDVRVVEAAWARALHLAESLGDVDHQLRSLWGLWLLEHRNALRVAQQFSAVAVTPADRLLGERMIGVSYHFRGNQRSARDHIERALAYDITPDSGSRIVRFQIDRRLETQTYLARILWLQGFPEQALHTAERAVEHVGAADHAISLCAALAQAACPIALRIGNLDLAEHYIGLLCDASTRHALIAWRDFGRAYQGLLFIARGDLKGGIPLLRVAFNELNAAFSGLRVNIFLGQLAAALGRAGKVSEGLAAINEAIDRAESTEERWLAAEVLRIKGELLSLDDRPGAVAEAEHHFCQALDSAREQGARSWELRAATSLAELWHRHGKSADAHRLLTSAYGRFTEGFETADLRKAKALLDALGWPT